MVAKMIVFAACVATALAQYGTPAYKPAYAPANAYAAEPAYPPKPYSFEYNVNEPSTYNVHSRSEYSDGNGNVKGSYSLVEPDGSIRVVEYTADDYQGFKAEVKKVYNKAATPYGSPAYNPAYNPAYPAPAYKSAAAPYRPY